MRAIVFEGDKDEILDLMIRYNQARQEEPQPQDDDLDLHDISLAEAQEEFNDIEKQRQNERKLMRATQKPKRRGKFRSHSRWTSEEDALLEQYLGQGMRYKVIAKNLHRTMGSVKARAHVKNLYRAGRTEARSYVTTKANELMKMGLKRRESMKLANLMRRKMQNADTKNKD